MTKSCASYFVFRCTGITEAKVWTLERRVFQKIMVRSGRQEQEDNLRFLASVPLLQGIHPIELTKISGFLKRVCRLLCYRVNLYDALLKDNANFVKSTL